MNDHHGPEYLAEQLVIAEQRIQETTGEEREEWKAWLTELERRALRWRGVVEAEDAGGAAARTADEQ